MPVRLAPTGRDRDQALPEWREHVGTPSPAELPTARISVLPRDPVTRRPTNHSDNLNAYSDLL